MHTRDDLVRAASLLAIAMSSGAVLSACDQPAHAQSAPPTTATAAGATDVAALRRAASVVRDWQRRDPAATAQVLHEVGLFACDETTSACIAAKNAAVASAQPAAPPAAPATAQANAAAPAHPAAQPERPSRPSVGAT